MVISLLEGVFKNCATRNYMARVYHTIPEAAGRTGQLCHYRLKCLCWKYFGLELLILYQASCVSSHKPFDN